MSLCPACEQLQGLLGGRYRSGGAVDSGSIEPAQGKETCVSLTFPLIFGVYHHGLGDIHRRCEEGPGESFTSPFEVSLKLR